MSENSPFSYTEVENFDRLLPVYSVAEKASQTYLGRIRGIGPARFEVQRPQDELYHSEFASRREAARWLRDHLTDKARFDE
jgi:hypothetical protein